MAGGVAQNYVFNAAEGWRQGRARGAIAPLSEHASPPGR